MSGWKDWQIGEVVEAAEFQTFLQDQVVQVYADSSARGSALGTAVAEGMASYVKDTDSFEVYDGSGWVPVSVDAAWVTAGTAGEILISNGTADPSWVAAETTLAAGSAGELVVSAGTAGVVYEAAESTLTAGTSGFTALSAGTAGISYQPVSHNYIINGAFDIWQRGTSFTNPANDTYNADRYTIGINGSGSAHSISRQAITPADVSLSGLGEVEYFLRQSQTTVGTSTLYDLRNLIEDVRTLAGVPQTLSFYAKADSSRTVTLILSQVFGSGGSASVSTTIGTVTVGTTWQRHTFTYTAPSISGKTIGAGSHVRLNLRHAPSATLVFDITGVQLEAGSVATPFKRHAPSLQGELAACQRYYYRTTSPGTSRIIGNGFGNTTTQARGSIQFPVRLRIAPSAIEQSGTASDYEIQRQGTNSVTCSAVPAFITASEDAAQFSFTVASGLTAGEGLQLRSATTSAYLGWSAEL